MRERNAGRRGEVEERSWEFAAPVCRWGWREREIKTPPIGGSGRWEAFFGGFELLRRVTVFISLQVEDIPLTERILTVRAVRATA
jgi:hypothetical protein